MIDMTLLLRRHQAETGEPVLQPDDRNERVARAHSLT